MNKLKIVIMNLFYGNKQSDPNMYTEIILNNKHNINEKIMNSLKVCHILNKSIKGMCAYNFRTGLGQNPYSESFFESPLQK